MTDDGELDRPSRAGFEARLGRGDTGFDARDAALLRAVDEHGSLNAAVEALGRSFAHAQRRVVALEEAFGRLVERRRGGAGGGGSELTDAARDLLARFDRLRAEFAGVAGAPHTVLAGEVVDRDGELASVDTPVGTVRALAPPDAAAVEVSVRADAVTLTAPGETPADDGTSARNRFAGTVAEVDAGETVATVTVSLDGGAELAALVTLASVERLGLEPGREAVATFKATATRAVPVD
ncbi:MAG: TOBE domain-containing protein [Halobacteriales archaeon]|nr:TOBE domain-containing protein [Halobacteriales archaeon]